MKKIIYLMLVIVFSSLPLSAFAYSYDGRHWHAEKASIRYAASLPESMKSPTFKGQQTTWDDGSPNNFYFYYDANSNNPIGYVAIDGRGGTIARVTLAWDSNNHITQAVMKYDNAEAWHTNVNTLPPSNAMDAWSVAAHEFGHWLRLGHSSNVDATMYGSIKYGESKKRTLHSDDLQGISNIYNAH